jgi:FkbM family methyltransferase
LSGGLEDDRSRMRSFGSTVRRALSEWFQKPPATLVDVPGMRQLQFALHTKPDIWISDPIRAGAIFDSHILSLLRVALRPGDVLADVGANVGWFSVIGSDLVGPTGKVFAFEPDPDNLKLLRRNLSLNQCRNVHVFGTALGSSNRMGTLYRSADNQGDHQMCVVQDRQDQVAVRIETLDHILGQQGGKVDFLKIDTQGSEVAILRGMQNVLRQKPNMVLEFWPHGLERCGETASALIDIIGPLGARLWLLLEDGSTRSVTADQLLELASTVYAPATVAHVDLAVISPKSELIVQALTSRQT